MLPVEPRLGGKEGQIGSIRVPPVKNSFVKVTDTLVAGNSNRVCVVPMDIREPTFRSTITSFVCSKMKKVDSKETLEILISKRIDWLAK